MPAPHSSLTLALLLAREAAMSFFRPLLNAHGLTEQQWRVIRILRQKGEMESFRLAEFACILRPSMTGVLARLERDGLIARKKSEEDQRVLLISLTNEGHQCFLAMIDDIEENYAKIRSQFGDDKMFQLLGLLDELKQVKP